MILIFNNIILYLLIITILLDVFLGSIRAIKESIWNSTLGINGILRKTAMLGSSIFLIIIDSFLKINLTFFLPDDINKILNLNQVGIFEIFGIMFILYETTSILKNMVKCGLPIPKKLKTMIENLLKKLTTEGGEKK